MTGDSAQRLRRPAGQRPPSRDGAWASLRACV